MSQYNKYRLSDSWGFKRSYTSADPNVKKVSDLGKLWHSLDNLQRADALGLRPDNPGKFGNCPLHYAAVGGHVDMVKWLTEQLSTYQIEVRDADGRTALHLAVIEKHVSIVRLLVETDVDVNIRDNDGMTPLHMAWVGLDVNGYERYEDIVEILVSSPRFRRFDDERVGVKKLYHMTVLSWAVFYNSHKTVKLLLENGLILTTPYQDNELITPLHIAANYGYHDIICTLLDYEISWMVNKGDYNGRTPLHMAVRGRYLECSKTLIDHGGNLAFEDKNGLTVMHLLFNRGDNQVAFLTQLLDAGVRIKEVRGINLHMAKLDFGILAPDGEHQMAVVSTLIKAVRCKRQMNVLQHPLVETFLVLKWRCLCHFFLILVAFQTLFVTSLFSYGVILLHKKEDNPAPRRALFVCSSIMLCHNIAQILMIPKYYAKQFETWLSLICEALCIVVAIAGEFGDNHPRYIDQTPSLVLQAIGVAIPLACIQMMFLIGQFPAWGYYALMFSTVLRNVSKVFLTIVWVIIGFSLSFSILFHTNEQFDNPAKAFVKTVVMMMGEYDYSNLFSIMNDSNSTINNESSNGSNTILLPIISRVIFLFFILFASIVLLNLMIGLAVTDIQGLMNEGLVLRLKKQAVFAAHLEQVTSYWILRSHWMPKRLRKMLESRNKISTEMILIGTAESGYKIINRWSLKYGPGRKMPPFKTPEILAEKLFDLASKNKHIHRTSKSDSPRSNNNDSLIDTFLHFQEAFKKMQREMMRVQGMQSRTCPTSWNQNME